MIVISEHDLGVVCDAGKCTRQAFYIVTVRTAYPLYRLYCPQCTARLLQRVAELLHDNDDGRPLHECVETEFLLTGESVNA